MGYRVKAALVTFRVADQLMYVYQDGVLPEGVDKDDLKHLLDSDLVEETEQGDESDKKAAAKKAAAK